MKQLKLYSSEVVHKDKTLDKVIEELEEGSSGSTIATHETLGSVIVGDSISVTEEGVINVDPVEVPDATEDVKGVAKLYNTVQEDKTDGAPSSDAVYNAIKGLEKFAGIYTASTDLPTEGVTEGFWAAVLGESGYPAEIWRYDGTAWEDTEETWEPDSAATAAVEQAKEEALEEIEEAIQNLDITYETISGDKVQLKNGGGDLLMPKTVGNNIYNDDSIGFGSIETLTGKYISPSTGNWTSNANYDSKLIPVNAGETLKIYPNSVMPSLYYCFVKTNTTTGTPSYATGWTKPISNAAVTVEVTIPNDAVYLYFTTKVQDSDRTPSEISYVAIRQQTILDVPLEVGQLSAKGGYSPHSSKDANADNGYAFSSEDGQFARWRSTPLLKIYGDFSYIVDVDCFCIVYFFDKNRQYIDRNINTGVSADTFVEIASKNAAFVRFVIYKRSGTAEVPTPRPKLQIKGYFPNGLEMFKLTKQVPDVPADTIITPVWIEDFFNSLDDTHQQQDTGAWRIDWGVIRFPENYDPDGEPTRLIIYCHGGTPRYNPVFSNYTADNFDTNGHIDPTLFLKEGYAVMDMDAVFCILNAENNEFDVNANSVRQTAQCYKAAYDYVIRNYNIREDGVLLGGYSFGASKCLQIIKWSGIPIVACCMLSPYIGEHWFWHYGYRTIMSETAGISNYESIDAAEINQSQADILKDNYPLIMRTSPMLSACKVSKEDFFATTHIDELDEDVSLVENVEDWGIYVISKWKATFDVPIKIWVCENDETAVPSRHADVLYNVALNGGSDIQLRMISGGSHQPALRDTAILINNYVTKYGETLASVPLVYAEMVRYWRRYEQNT